MPMPYHKVNVPTGTKMARVIEDGGQYADLIKKAQRPLLIVGARCLTDLLDEKLLLDLGPRHSTGHRHAHLRHGPYQEGAS